MLPPLYLHESQLIFVEEERRYEMNTQTIIKDGIELGKFSKKENASSLFGRKAVQIVVATKIAQYDIDSVEDFVIALDVYASSAKIGYDM
jgi:hypothetical protein